MEKRKRQRRRNNPSRRGRVSQMPVGFLKYGVFAAVFSVLFTISIPMAAQQTRSPFGRGIVQPRAPLGPGIQQYNVQRPRTPQGARPSNQFNQTRTIILPNSSGEILINSYAPVVLKIQLFRPQSGKWTEVQLQPLNANLIRCDECKTDFNIAFYDGKKQITQKISAGSTMSIRSVSNGTIWQLKLDSR